jgi:outer membrane protein insertion porin family
MFKNLIKFTVIIFLFIGDVFAESFIDYSVTGNKRVSNQTIFNFSKLKEGVDLSKNDLNNALKKIYESNFFEEVSINILNDTLNISVKEYPIIQDVEFKGIKAKKYVDALRDQIKLKPKSSFNEFTLEADVNLISNILRKSGFYFSTVDVQKKINSNNTINITYDITMGDKAIISEIKFIGNKKFKSSKLYSVIMSEENKFWKFLSQNKYLDKERTKLDKRLLKNFYLDKGYYDVSVEDVYTQIIDEKSFSLTYKIDSGNKYFFNTFEIIIPDDYDLKDFDELIKVFKSLEKSRYSYESINSILKEIDKIAAKENYEFIDVAVEETVKDKNKIDFVFNIKESDKFYVESINILGNNITNEEFIRQQLVVDEGDPFNKLLHNKTINKLKSVNIFKSVKSNIKEGKSKGLKIIDITVEEKPTGEISAGAGYGSSGSSFSIGIKENNFSGKGIKLDANLALTQESIRGKFAYTNPNFLYSDRVLTTSIESTATDKEKDYGFKSSLNRIALGTSFEQFENLYFSPMISVAHESLTTTANASANYKKQEGAYFDSIFNYSLTYDQRNSPYRPTEGYVSTILQEIPLVSRGYAIINGYQIKGYKEIVNDSVLSVGLYTQAITSLKTNTDVRVSKRLFLPESKLRGFKSGKVGPKDGADYVGGNYMASFNTALSLPFLFPTFDKVDFALFFDAANIWHVDYSKNVDQGNTVRTATGVAVDIITPMGPLSFSFAKPITKADGDTTQGFRFNLGTTF